MVQGFRDFGVRGLGILVKGFGDFRGLGFKGLGILV